MGILDPALQTVGYGSYREADGGLQMGGAVNVIQDMTKIVTSTVPFPLLWPGPEMVVPIHEHWGEYPDPLTSCPGYSAPAGLPVIVQIGAGDLFPQVVSSTVRVNAVPVDDCVYDETSYNNPVPAQQALGRGILGSRDAIVIIPRAPLAAGAVVDVELMVNDQRLVWWFRIANSGSLRDMTLDIESAPPGGRNAPRG